MYFKMMINFLQMMIVSQDIQLDWPPEIREFFEAQLNVGNPSTEIFSFDCLLSNYGMDIVYLKLILVFCLPFLLIFILILFFSLLLFWRKVNYFNDFISGSIITCFIMQPIIINSCFSLISCTEIDPNQYFLTFFKNTKCYTEQHYFFVIILKKD